MKWYDFTIIKGQIPYNQEALHIQKIQEVYFLAWGQYELSLNHAYLPDRIKQRNKSKKEDKVRSNCSPLNKQQSKKQISVID